MNLSFPIELWGSSKIVYDRYEEGRNTLSFLLNFVRETIAIEEKSATKLQKLCARSIQWTEKGTLKDSWEATKKWHEESSKNSLSICNKLQVSIVQPLSQLKKDQETLKSNLHKDIIRLDQGLEKGRDLLNKAKAKFYKASKDYETTCTELNSGDLKPKDLEKLKLRSSSEKTLLDNTLTVYQQNVEEFRTYQVKYETQMKEILAQFEEMEVKRLSIIKEIMESFVRIQEENVQDQKESLAVIRGPTQQIDCLKDLKNFIDINRTHNVPDPLVEFEPYDSNASPDHDDSKKDKKKNKKFLPFGGKKDKKSDSPDTPTEESPVKEEPKHVEQVKISDTVTMIPPVDTVDNPNVVTEDSSVVKEDTKPVAETEQISKSVQVKTPKPEPTIVTAPPKTIDRVAYALFDFNSEDPADISFTENTLIVVTKGTGEIEGMPQWMEGKLLGKTGYFPSNHVDILVEYQKCIALYDFCPSSTDELSLSKGDELVIQSEMDGWYAGNNADGYYGLFPSNYVKLL